MSSSPSALSRSWAASAMAFLLAFSNNDSRYSGVTSLSESDRSESLSVLESDKLESELDAWLSSIIVRSVRYEIKIELNTQCAPSNYR